MGEFQILSDPVDPSIAARLELEAKIMADEQIFMPPLSGSLAGWEETASVTDDRTADAVAIADDDLAALDGIDPAILEAKTIPSSPPRRFRPAAEAKLELPLLDSLTAAPCPALRKVTFEEVASEGLLAAVDAAQIPPEEPESDLQQALGDAAQRFLESVEHERLVPGETSMRILAPALSFEKKTLPWKEKIVLDRARLQASFFNEADLPDAQPIEQATSGALRWNPFPSVSRDGLLKETIDSTDSIDRLLAVTGFNEPMNSDDFFWKPEGLRIFDNSHDSDQPELLPAIFPRPKDIQGLVRKRKHDADRETGGGIGEKSTSNPATKVMKQLSNDSASTGMTSLLQEALLRRRQKAQPQRPMNMGEPAVVLDDGLIGFLRSRHQTVLATPGLQQLAMAPNLMDAAQGGISPQREVSAAQKPRSKTVSSISGVQVSRTFVISSRFLRENLSLLRQIELLYPNASLLERSSMLGFDEARKPHDRRPSLLPSSPPLTDLAHQSEPNSGDHSVDLQLDPTTGFVFTSVGFIKQRPLPGQKTITGGIRERVMSAVRLAESSSGIDRLGSTRSRTNSDKQVADWKLYVIVILPPSDSWETADSSRTADRQALEEFEGWILRLAEWSGIDVRMKAWQDDGVKDGERPEPLRGLALELVKAMVCHDGFASEL